MKNFPPPYANRQQWLDRLREYPLPEQFEIIEWLVDRQQNYRLADELIQRKMTPTKGNHT